MILRLPAILVGLLVGCTGACSPQQAVCAKIQECDPKLEPDSQAVCVEEANTRINALRANAEPECHLLADAILALDACAASLDCDDFEEADLGEKCDPELDAFEDALGDTRPGGENRCSSFN